MANVRDVRLNMGEHSTGTGYVEISFTIDFTSREVSDNQLLGLYVSLWQRANTALPLAPSAVIGCHYMIEYLAHTNTDGFNRWWRSTTVRPEGQDSRTFILRRDFEDHKPLVGNEQFQGFVYIIPEVQPLSGWSNEVMVKAE